jgi:signal transduction histidine kinase
VRRRLVLAIAGVATAAVILFALPLALVLQRAYHDEDLLRLQRDTVAATREINLGAPSGDPVELPPFAGDLGVYDRAGRRTTGAGFARADPLVGAALRTGRPTDRDADGLLSAAVPLLAHERVVGAVRAQRSDARARDDTRRAWLALLAAAVSIIALAALAAVVLGRRLTAPLERLAAVARRLGEGDFSARAPPAGVAELDAVGGALDATAARLDDLVSRERAFSTDASHQLRTPLAALRIELEAMELRGDHSPEVEASLAQVERLQSTVDTLLSVARDTPRSAAGTNVAELLDRLEHRWRGVLAAGGRPLRVAVSAERLVVSASSAVLDEVLDVLIANAHRHGSGEVAVTARDVRGSVALDVTDEGEGFAGGLEDAFTRRSGSGEGHGIGLALARSLTQAEGGRLDVTHAGPRPVVTVLLPRSTGSEAKTPSGASAHSGGS